MELIDVSKLVSNTKDNSNKQIQCFTSSEGMFEFFKLQNNFFKHTKSNLSLYDLSSWIISKNRFLLQQKSINNKRYKRGQIIYIDFGINYNGEISYNHPGVVLSETYSKVLIVPCSSSRIRKAYDAKNKLFPEYLIGEPTDGFTKKTVLLLDDVRWVSKSRILKDFPPISSNLFKNIQDKFLELSANVFLKKITTLENLKNSNSLEIEELKKQLEKKDLEIEELKEKILNLQKK